MHQTGVHINMQSAVSCGIGLARVQPGSSGDLIKEEDRIRPGGRIREVREQAGETPETRTTTPHPKEQQEIANT